MKEAASYLNKGNEDGFRKWLETQKKEMNPTRYISERLRGN